VIEAPYLWRDAAHMAKVGGSPIFEGLNKDLVAKRGMRMLAVTYYGKRHLTSGSKQIRTVGDMAGFKLRVPCSEPTKLDRFWLESSVPIPQAGRSATR